jgi:hypothetical protein
MRNALLVGALWVTGAAILVTAVVSSPVVANDGGQVIVKGSKKYASPVSLYQGRWYVEADNATRVCIRHRESRHEYAAVSSTGKYRGAYQFSPELGVGAGWMVQKELRETGTKKRDALYVGRLLRSHPVNQWSPYYQEMAYWLVWRKGRGKSHWPTGPGCPGY